jgi:hypothetical protein
MEGRLRDAYGLPVPLDYEELNKTYDPIHQELDSCASHQASKFFYSAATCLGVPVGPSSAQDGQLCLQDPGSQPVVVQVLEQLLARGERHAPEVRRAGPNTHTLLLLSALDSPRRSRSCTRAVLGWRAV